MSRADRFLKACRKEEPDCTPVWFMRQAGRYLPEYRAVRAKVPFLTLCKTPELAAEVTLQPVDILGVDAAILFSDILVVPEAMGMDLVLDDAGPQFPRPLRGPEELMSRTSVSVEIEGEAKPALVADWIGLIYFA